jgi:hypothetical protein
MIDPPGNHQTNGSAPLPTAPDAGPFRPVIRPTISPSSAREEGVVIKEGVFRVVSKFSKTAARPVHRRLAAVRHGGSTPDVKPPVPCDETGFTHIMESPGAHGGPGKRAGPPAQKVVIVLLQKEGRS